VGGFDSKLSDFINTKYSGGWKYKDCHYETEGDKRSAFCVFKRLSSAISG
jgi:hypothetical protein